MSNEPKNRSKYFYLIIGVLVLLFLVYYCSKNKPLPGPVKPEDSSRISSLPSFYAINIPLIPQKGSNSCWAATLEMINTKDSIYNKKSTETRYLQSIIGLLPGYGVDESRKMNEPGWNKIKQHLANKKAIVTYKYFDQKFAHVFLVKGYQETPNSRWLIANDPYPVRNGKIVALAFNQFLRPFDNQIDYKEFSFSVEANNFKEPTLALLSNENLQSKGEPLYTPPGISLNNKTNLKIEESDVWNLSNSQIKTIKNLKKDFFDAIAVSYDPGNEVLKLDKSSFLRINQFHDIQRFSKYDNTIDAKTSYLFDNEKLAFVNFTKNNNPLISNTFEIQDLNNKKTLYLSRFEKYETSEMKNWETIKNAVLGNQHRLAGWLSSKKNQVQARISSNPSSPQLQIPAEDFSDISILNLPGGMIFSFKWEQFKEDKLVADPYRQLKSKSGKAVFVADGIPFYRLQDIILPERGELILNEDPVAEEWKQDIQAINLSTGISSEGSALTLGSKDQIWKILEIPGNNPWTIAPYAGFWQPTPVTSTSAQWVGISDRNDSQPPGTYTFEREINLNKTFGKLEYNFTLAYDDDLLSIQLVSPSGNIKNISVEGLRNPPPKGYYLGKIISGEMNSEETGKWKIRIKVKFIDTVAGLIVSGKVKTKW